MLPQNREKLLLSCPRGGIILTLIHAGAHQALALTDSHNLLDLVRSIVTDAEFLEAAGAKVPVHGAARLDERRGTLRPVQVHDMHSWGVERG